MTQWVSSCARSSWICCPSGPKSDHVRGDCTSMLAYRAQARSQSYPSRCTAASSASWLGWRTMVTGTRSAPQRCARGTASASASATSRAAHLSSCASILLLSSGLGWQAAHPCEGEEDGADVGEIPDFMDALRRGAEAEDGNRRQRVVARREVLHVAMVARDEERPAVRERRDERAQEGVEPRQRLERVLHRARVSGLVGLEELEQREVVPRRHLEEDLRGGLR